RHTRFSRDWSSDVCSSDLPIVVECEIPSDITHVEAPVELFTEGGKKKARGALIGFWKKAKGDGNESQRNSFHHQVCGSGNNLIFRNNPLANLNAEVRMWLWQVAGTVQAVIKRHLVVLVLAYPAGLDKPAIYFGKDAKGYSVSRVEI